MKSKEIYQELTKVFSFDEINWQLAGTFNEDGVLKGIAKAFVTKEAIQQRLDKVIGFNNWKFDFNDLDNKTHFSILSIYDSEKKEWFSRSDAFVKRCETVDFTNSFIRAAKMFGIGMYLTNMKVIVELDVDNKTHKASISANQDETFFKAYKDFLKSLKLTTKEINALCKSNKKSKTEKVKQQASTKILNFIEEIAKSKGIWDLYLSSCGEKDIKKFNSYQLSCLIDQINKSLSK